MTKTVIIAAVSWIIGAALGYILCGATIRYLHGRVRDLRAKLRGKEGRKKMGTMDKILILEAVVLIAYTTAVLFIFWHTATEPATLTTCVFGVCGIENGVMGWIKTNKDKADEKARAGAGDHVPLADKPEPPDVGT